MPTMPMSAQEAGSFAWLYATAFMAHPTDETKREEYLYWVLAKMHLATDECEIQFSRDGFAALVSAAGRGVQNDLSDATIPGSMAGEVLLYVLRAQQSGIKDVGLDKAQFLASKFFTGTHRRDGEKYRGTGRDTVLKNWTRFRSVAHFWAAHNVLCYGAPDGNSDAASWLAERQNMHLGIAHHLLGCCTAHNLHRSKETLLRADESWKMDGIMSAQISLPRLSEDEIDALKGFEPRHR